MLTWPRWLRSAHPIPLHSTRLVVFDLETTGLNLRKDKPIAIGAVAVCGQSMPLADQFQAHIQQSVESSAQAALAHRLARDQIGQAAPPEDVLPRFLDYLAEAPRFAYHSAFDDGFMQRSLRASGISRRWRASLDVAQWVLWLYPELGPAPPTLDRALAFARIRRSGRQRHDALVDASLTAQLVMTLMPATRARGVHTLSELRQAMRSSARLRQMQTQ